MSKPWAVLTADVHYNLNTLPVADAAMRQGIELASDLMVPFIIAGDLNDTKAILRAEVMNALIELMKYADELGVRVIVIPGNHCMINEKGKAHSLGFLDHYCHLYDQTTHDLGLNIWFIPYQSTAEAFKEELAKIPHGSTVIIHQGVNGANMSHYMVDHSAVDKEVLANYRVIGGHYHTTESIKCGRPRKGAVGLFSFIGNPYTLTFAEAGTPKGIQVLSTDGTLEFEELYLRKHVVLNVTTDELQGAAPFSDMTPFGDKDLVWLKVTGPKTELEKLNKKAIGMKFFGHQNFKLDKIEAESDATSTTVEDEFNSTAEEELDRLIEATKESKDVKAYLQALWREIIA